MIGFDGKYRKFIVVAVLSMAAVLVFALYQLPDSRFHVYFLDVGQGDSILIKTPQNHQILIDGGPGNFVIEQLSETMPFFDKSIDLVVLTHPHADHLDGLVEVLKRYEVAAVLITGVHYPNTAYQEFLEIVSDSVIPLYLAKSSVDFRFGAVLFDTIYPLHSVAGQSFKNINNSSIGLRIGYSGRNVILTGDLEIEAETELLASDFPALLRSGRARTYIFKAGHHGSRTSSSWDFLRVLKPEIVVISAGTDNQFGHPHPETVRNFHRIGAREIHRTDLEGRIEFSW